MTTLWGIDLGGTKIEGVVLKSSKDLEPLCRIRVPSLAEDGYEPVIGQIRKLVGEMKAACGERSRLIGFGTPGTIDHKLQTLKHSNSTCLNNHPLQRDIEAALGHPILVANDANCFTLAEARFGAAAAARTVFGVIMGSGVGGGIIVDGKIWGGPQGIAGEWGHNVLEPDGDECYCGKKGCVETVISGKALERHYVSQGGEQLSLSDITARAESGEELAQATMRRLYYWFGRGLAVVINILDPDVIVLGGGVSNVKQLYSNGVKEVAKWVFNNRLDTKIVPNQLGDSAGVFGAALLSEKGLFY